MPLSASTYFRVQAELMQALEITDARGESLALEAGAARAAEMLSHIQATGAKIIVIGNGGSAAIADHLQMDLCNAAGIRALVFDMGPMLSALSNDHGYGCVFERPITQWAEPGDLLIAISSSGQSENILRGARAAASKGARILTLSGFKPDNPLRGMGDLNFYAPSSVYGHVELAHSILAHFLSDGARLEHESR